MGVPGFFSWLLRNKRKINYKLIIEKINKKIKYLMLDTNCLLHPCVKNIIDKYKKGDIILDKNKSIRMQLEDLIWNKIMSTIDDMIMRLKPEYVYIAIDGVAPMGKILQQRQRRYKYLYDAQIKLNNGDNSTNIDNIEFEPNNKNDIDGLNVPKIPLSSKSTCLFK